MKGRSQFNVEVGKRIRTVMDQIGVRQTDLAEKVGVNPVTVNRWLSAQSEPSLELLVRICDALDCPPEVLLDWKGAGRLLTIYQKAKKLDRISEILAED